MDLLRPQPVGESYGAKVSASLEENPLPTFPSVDQKSKGRFETEAADLTVVGEIPKQLQGTFYRILVDPFYEPPAENPPIEGDGNVCAFRIQDGRVDMKMRYVDTERLRLERQAKKRLFGLYRNPFSHHPCVRAAIDSTANTNLVYWAGKLMALKESALPYEIDVDTLETIGYDPFKSPGLTFSAHPKVDPYSNELVVFGYEAKGLCTDDIVIYALDKEGQVHDEQWIKSPWLAFIHDSAITPNFIILVLWPYDAEEAQMKAGGHHWRYNKDRPATFIVVPRRNSSRLPKGWSPGEYRVYHWEHAMLLHTAGAWEEWVENDSGDVEISLESSRMMYHPFPMFDPTPSEIPFGNMEADYVRWTLDLTKPSGAKIDEPKIIVNMPGEMARIDERFLTHPYNHIFLPVVVPGKSSHVPPLVPLGLNGYILVDKKGNRKGKDVLYDPGPNCTVEEPIFIPRSLGAPEGDGWVLGMVQRVDIDRSELVVLDTANFDNPVAAVQLPFMTKGQVHGNWVEGGLEMKSLVRNF
ncbi:lignostilbene dioxygenase family protein [Colletotrichum truncatum]|uniref:Lignostilbene dioxygenase family protein n=1 Tax=Colletotrichum truncatum TaxID=5467 RepID=A0ACC3ZLW7_COLTU|nr:lignostilbene dioxygenase family protein [Colletotrichum truncatum]KAF6783956.1 lignostilbene dioxygenase family protein [Colletotrichum truncatum]